MLKNISKNCECMFFETGQNNEKKMSWSQSLEFMGNDSRIWVRKKFKEFGFKKIYRNLTFNGAKRRVFVRARSVYVNSRIRTGFF